jgi:hypothetical protein
LTIEPIQSAEIEADQFDWGHNVWYLLGYALEDTKLKTLNAEPLIGIHRLEDTNCHDGGSQQATLQSPMSQAVVVIRKGANHVPFCVALCLLACQPAGSMSRSLSTVEMDRHFNHGKITAANGVHPLNLAPSLIFLPLP